MTGKLHTYLLYGKRYASLEVTTHKNEHKILGVTAQKKKGEFVEIESLSVNSFTGISKELTKETHAYVSITTDQVLIKESVLKERDVDMFKEAYPGLKQEDFYYELLKTSNKAFVAVARKEYVEHLLEEFETHNIHVLGFHLGFTKLNSILPFVEESTLETSRFSIDRQVGEITSFRTKEEEIVNNYKVGDVEIQGDYLLSLAGLSSYLSPSNAGSNVIPKNNELQQLYTQKAIFKRGLLGAAAFFLGVLLINALLFTEYHTSLSQLQEESKLVLAQKERFADKQEQIAKKEQIVQNIMLSGNSKSVFYMNRIASSLPESITLTELTFQPLEKSIRTDKPILYKMETVLVAGKSGDKEVFNNWISSLNKNTWVEKVSIHGYTEGAKETDFGIVIQIHDDKE